MHITVHRVAFGKFIITISCRRNASSSQDTTSMIVKRYLLPSAHARAGRIRFTSVVQHSLLYTGAFEIGFIIVSTRTINPKALTALASRTRNSNNNNNTPNRSNGNSVQLSFSRCGWNHVWNIYWPSYKITHYSIRITFYKVRTQNEDESQNTHFIYKN